MLILRELFLAWVLAQFCSVPECPWLELSNQGHSSPGSVVICMICICVCDIGVWLMENVMRCI